ncbi:MAG: FAD-binding domain-containing protein [Vulcanimicrobiaceae bacterium]
MLQSKKFDPGGTFIRKMIPELANVPDEFIHSPWEMPLRLRAVKRYARKKLSGADRRARSRTCARCIPRSVKEGKTVLRRAVKT